MKKTFPLFVIFLVISSLLISACSAWKSKSAQPVDDSNGYYSGYDYEYDTAEVMMDYAAEVPVSAYAKDAAMVSNNSESNVQNRMIQKSASINIQVMDPIDASVKLTNLTEQMGGFVVSSSTGQDTYSGNIKLPRVTLSIRVPAERLNETLDFIEHLTADAGKDVSNKKVWGKDITSEYVDTTSRLTSLEKTRDKLYEILDTAENAEEALEVYTHISQVESDIEVYKGQIKYMEESVALSSIDVQITSIRPDPIQTVSTWSLGEVFKDAFERLLDGGKSVIEAVVYFFIVVIPILILIAIPVVAIILIIRKLLKNKKAKNSDNANVSGPKSEDVLTEVRRE